MHRTTYLECSNTELHVFDSITDVAKMTDGKPNHGYDGKSTKRWLGRTDLRTWDKVISATRTPWKKGITFVESMTRAIDDSLPRPIVTRRRRRFRDDIGDGVDYDRLRSGVAFWETTEQRKSSGSRPIDIVVDISTSSRVSADDALWRTIASLALTIRLEASGFRVAIWLVTYSDCRIGVDGRKLMTVTNVKRHQDRVDLSSLTSTMSIWYFRTVMFSLFDQIAGERDYRRTYGAPETPTESQYDAAGIGNDRIRVERIFSERSAVQFVNDTLAELECHHV